MLNYDALDVLLEMKSALTKQRDREIGAINCGIKALKAIILQSSYGTDWCKNCQEEIDCLVKGGWKKCARFN